MNVVIAIVVVVVVGFTLLRLATRGQKIANPRLGLLDLTEGKSEGIVAEDPRLSYRLFVCGLAKAC